MATPAAAPQCELRTGLSEGILSDHASRRDRSADH